MRLLAAVTTLAIILTLATQTSTRAQETGTTITGPGLAYPVRLSPTDEDAFFRRINLPPKLTNPASAYGPAYTVTSPYWDLVVRGDRTDRPPAEASAVYYPEGGFVRARQGGEDVWLVIDLRQRAVLERYIRLAKAGQIPAEPGTLQVLAAAAVTEPISIDVGQTGLSQTDRDAFWRAVAPYVTPPASVPRPGEVAEYRRDEAGAWLVFGLPESRSVQFFYAPSHNVLIDSTGFEVLPVPRLLPLFGTGGTTPGEPPRGGESQVPQAQGRGSTLWWPLMAGGGLACLAAALWLSKRTRTA
jgi:hypothetical protein